jgi:hypothetical protein
MAKKVRKPRSESPRTYAQLKDAPPPSSAAPAAATEPRAASRGRSAQAGTTVKATAVDWQAEYGYVFKDLRRTFVLAAGLLILLIVLNFALQVV